MKKIIFPLVATVAFCSHALAQNSLKLNKNNISSIVAAMTIDEKIDFLKGVGMGVLTSEDGPVAGTIGGRVKGAAGSTVKIPRLGIPEMILADGPAGLRIEPVIVNGELQYTTAFPVGTALASTWNTELTYQVGEAMGNEVREYGVDVILAPGINIQRDLLCGRNFEYFSEDPVVSGNIGAALINGIQSKNVGTSIKHFAVNNQETSRNNIDAIVSQRALREIYLKAFKIALTKSKPWTVMSSYNKVNGTYTSENKDLLTTILRDEWNYPGLVMTDWYAGKEFDAQVRAGNDLLMPGRKQEPKKIKEAYLQGGLSQEEIDRNVKRILEVIVKTSTFKNYNYSNQPNKAFVSKTAKAAATEGMVLLKNEKVLPFATKNIALLGNSSYDTFIGGTGSGEVKTVNSISFHDGLSRAGFKFDQNLRDKYLSFIEKEKAARPKRTSVLEAIKPVKEMEISSYHLDSLVQINDVALITLGRNAGEGTDRDLDIDYRLSEKEMHLIKTTSEVFHKNGKKVLVALNIDALVEMASWRDLVDGILITWLPGQEAGLALADIVSGKVSPSGRLTQTIPLKYSDSPSANTFPGTPKNRPRESYYEEGIFVGYRYFSTFTKPVAYEFGYGLSYTKFELPTVKLSSPVFNNELEIAVKAKNIGSAFGKEVVQLYVSAPGKSMDKPELELKAFEKTKSIAPGKSQNIKFKLSSSDLASFDTARSAWIVEPGIYTVKVGVSSQKILQTKTFTIDKEIIVEKVHNVLKPIKELNELKK